MGILKFIKRKELKEIKSLQAQLIAAGEKEVAFTTQVKELKTRCEEVLTEKCVLENEREKCEQEKQNHINTIETLTNDITRLKKELATAGETEIDLSIKIEELEARCKDLAKYSEFVDIDKEKQRYLALFNEQKEHLEQEQQQAINTISSLQKEITSLSEDIEFKKLQIIELDETILLQEFGMYSPVYDFATSDLYKERLTAIRAEQKRMLLDKTAATCSTQWTLNGSIAQGRVMTNQNIKQILRCFNEECDILIDKVKFNNITAFIAKIQKSYDTLNAINSKNAVSISEKYLDLKIQELRLAYEYAQKKQAEKEEQRRIKEQMREEARLQKEIEEARKDLEKEQKHYINALIKVNKQIASCDIIEKEILLDKKRTIEKHLTELDVRIKNIDYREANKRAGYVYVISNIRSFGENVYKIGMTRRLDPMERVHELGDASVPFKFDVHAMIFSDDAPTLETALHHAFENKKVNMINGRREFFNVTIDEIEEVVKANYDKSVDFVKIPQAEQYRESKKLLDLLKNAKVQEN